MKKKKETEGHKDKGKGKKSDRNVESVKED
jgi:hypothetical protein